MRPLEGLLVIALEQAVAAPLCTARLADAGARVIKIERPEGDFARGYDALANGLSSYFVWLNRGKESIALDLTQDDDRAILKRMIAKADVLVQNLKPGALARLGLPIASLRDLNRQLITLSIAGFDADGPYADRKAYDLLIQAESGLSSVTGGPEAPARVGISIVDLGTGLNAYSALLEALIRRGRTGEGADLAVSLFESTAELMTVPLLQHEGGKTPERIGLAHPSIAPYGVFRTRDDVDILISIQSDREWISLATHVLENKALANDPDFATNVNRVARRAETDRKVADVMATLDADGLIAKLLQYDIAFGRVNDIEAFRHHPHLKRMMIETENGALMIPHPPAWQNDHVAARVPRIDEQGEAIRAEFSGA